MKNFFYFLGVGVFVLVGIFAVIFTGNLVRSGIVNSKVLSQIHFGKIPALYHQTGFQSHGDTQSKAGLSVTAKLGADTIDDTGYLFIKLAADKKLNLTESHRQPLNLAIVVDRSGSMSGEKLNSVKQALLNVESFFSSNDYVSLIVYDDTVQTVYSGYFNQHDFEHTVREIESGGSTNLEGGLRAGLERMHSKQVLEEFSDVMNTHNHVIVLSDGLANVGLSSASQLASIVESSANDNSTVSTIGVGSDYDENVMTAIAIAGKGKYYFMESATQAQSIFTQEIASLQTTAFRDMKVEIELEPQFSLRRAVGYQALSGNAFQPHDLSAGGDSSYVFELHHSLVRQGKTSLGKVIVRFYDVKTQSNEAIELPIEVEVKRGEVNPLSDNEVYEEYMRSYVAEKLWEVDQNLNEVKNGRALEVLNEVEVELNAASQRIPTFANDLESVHQKQEYLKVQGSTSVLNDVRGRNFKKLNQAESFDIQYNR